MPLLSLIAALALASAAPEAAPMQAPAVTTRPADAAAFSRLTVPDGDGLAIEAGVWTPPGGGRGLPLVVISHGNGGDFRSHEDTAQALAAAGFVVAALTHTGDNWRDQSRATDVAGRPRQLSVLIDYMLTGWAGRVAIDPQRVGAFGFSAGGFTVLTAAGGQADVSRIGEHCQANPGFYDCRLIAARPVAEGSPAWTRDTRIKAAVVAAPALGFAFTREGLAGVKQPVQLWQAGGDQVLPAPWYVEPVRAALPTAPEFHQVEGAGHFDFLRPCTPQLAAAAPAVCAPTPGFDRAKFHERFNAEVVRFLKTRL
ncbi:prolyl oligopeptidase family serine peptidase [Phenylobacterium sp. NIBR 498073]|uniref:alpha/beta hydrolase family protein n=1 Tax=Phenylobacterium sp. NIBR 498073 TaxID=3015177 RepID=UPI0022B58884|nr:prolyl oligopeptidase family serine peptidase [Phenylobacterium sp. NIBR 498073]WGU39620.1 prolyl oligopeptidase family serine peptidase [Phenylobacterium sp. NIBR 498073]